MSPHPGASGHSTPGNNVAPVPDLARRWTTANDPSPSSPPPDLDLANENADLWAAANGELSAGENIPM